MFQKKSTDMLEGSPLWSLVFFAMPMIIGNLFQQFYNMADSAIVGKFVSENALAAVGASYSLTNVFICIAIGGGVGSSVLTSQYLGSRDYRSMKTSVYTALTSFFAVSVVLAVFGAVASPAIMVWLRTPENIFAEAVLYLRIYFVGLPFLFMYNVLASVFNSLGKSKIPLYFLIFSSILNVIMDLFMVIVMHMGVAGVALATIIAQGISAVISFSVLVRYLKSQPEQGVLFDGKMLGRMVKIALPSILQQSIVSIGMMLVQSVVNSFGSAALAGYSAGMRIEGICIVPMSAMGNAVSTFTAQNIGADQKDRVVQGYHAAYGIVAFFGVLILVILETCNRGIIGAFLGADSTEIALSTGVSYLRFMGLFFTMIGLKMITDGLLRGAGDMTVFTISNLVNLGIRVAFAFLMSPVLGMPAIWYAVPIGWTANYLISFWEYRTGKWRQKQIR